MAAWLGWAAAWACAELAAAAAAAFFAASSAARCCAAFRCAAFCLAIASCFLIRRTWYARCTKMALPGWSASPAIGMAS